MGLLGTYEGRIDPQSRVVVPQKFREAVEGGMVLARGFEEYIAVYPPVEWEQLSNRVKQFSPFDRDGRQLRRLTFSGAFNATLDRAGRVLIPQALRQYASIADDVVMIGQDTYFEIWSPEKWQQQESGAGSLADIAQALDRASRSQRDAGGPG
jgi:MraZ protein